MYLDRTVQIPDVPGRISLLSKGKSTYVRYLNGRTYHPDRKYSTPQYRTIGKLDPKDSARMFPNENFYKYFGDSDAAEEAEIEQRSSCMRIGSFLAIETIIRECGLLQRLEKQFGSWNAGLLLDLAACSTVCGSEAELCYSGYAYNHPLFAHDMHIYSDFEVSAFLSSITDDQRAGFFEEWNASRDHREKIYLSFDAADRSSEAGELRMAESGSPEDNGDLPVLSCAVAYDKNNCEPLFYEPYPDGILDVSQLRFMLGKAAEYGYRRVGFVFDRGVISMDVIRYLDECGCDCCIMVKGTASFVKERVLAARGTFENRPGRRMQGHGVCGTTVKRPLYAGDVNEKYFHIYYSDQEAAFEKEQLEARLEGMRRGLEGLRNSGAFLPDGSLSCFAHEMGEDGTFLHAGEFEEAIDEARSLCGYFVIVTSQKRTAEEALNLYRGRDASETLFRGDRFSLSSSVFPVQTEEEASSGRVFLAFLTMLIRSRIRVLLKAEAEQREQQNCVTVSEAIGELEKIEMIRGYDGRWRLDHAVSERQRKILKAFHMDAESVKQSISRLGGQLESGRSAAEGRQ